MLLDVLTGKLTFQSLKPCNLETCTKKEIRDYFENSYSLNESIFVGLADQESLYKCPDRLRLPLIFYYGHTASVYVNKLILAGLLQPEDRVNLEMETLCETGVDEMSWDDTENYRMGGKFQWPDLSVVVDYRRRVKELILRVIDETPLTLPITMDSPWWGLMMGMEHERIHIETSSVLIRQLPLDMVAVPNGWKTAPPKHEKGAGQNSLVSVSPTSVTLGKPKDFPSYGWDNEYGQITCKVEAFEASKYPITNREFYQFVLDGGYETPAYWSDEGWNWVKYKQVKHPVFWVCHKGCKSGCGADLASYTHCKPLQHDTAPHCNGHHQVDGNGHQGKDEGGGPTNLYRLRCMYHEIDMPWDWPVEVNYLEAKAFCQWKGPGYRLLCEAEHNAIRGPMAPPDDGVLSDIIFQEDPKANLNMTYGSSTPVNMHAANGAGFHDVFGNTWEWVEDHFNGFPGFETHPLYDDFSSPTFDGKHNVILGGSWISTGDEASRFARYAFRRHFFQHCGFRVARSLVSGSHVPLPVRTMDKGVYVLGYGVDEVTVMLDREKYAFTPVETTNSQYLYETDEMVNDMIRLEYTHASNMSAKLANKLTQILDTHEVNHERALHAGCGTGATTYKVAQHFDEVLGQDFCARFVVTCQQLQRENAFTYIQTDGFKRTKQEVTVPQKYSKEKGNITFKQLTWLSNEVGSFDFVLSTALDRSQRPEAWLLRFPEVVKPDGLLVVVSAHAWTEERLNPFLHKFVMLEAGDVAFSHFGSEKEARVSVWRRTQYAKETAAEN